MDLPKKHWWVVGLLLALAFVLVTTTTPPRAWPTFVLLTGLALGALLVAEMPLTEGLKRSTVALPFAGMVALSLPFTQAGQVVWSGQIFGWTLNITDEGLILFAVVVIKAWLSVLVSGLLVATTAFTGLLKAMRSLHAPVVLTATISFMYRYLFVLVDEAMRLQTAREARSAGSGGTVWWRARVLGQMLGSLFIRSYERSERIYAAMLSRGFAGSVRTLTQLTWQARDSWAGLAWAVALVAVTIVGRMLIQPRMRTFLSNLVVRIQDLSFSYPDGRQALVSINLDVISGEKIAVVGPNGAGKSTLLLHLNGILRGEGQVQVAGLDVDDETVRAVRARVGLVFQDPDDQLFRRASSTTWPWAHCTWASQQMRCASEYHGLWERWA